MDIEDPLVEGLTQVLYEEWAKLRGVKTPWEEVATRGDKEAMDAYLQAFASVKFLTSFFENAEQRHIEKSDAAQSIIRAAKQR